MFRRGDEVLTVPNLVKPTLVALAGGESVTAAALAPELDPVVSKRLADGLVASGILVEAGPTS